MREIKVNELKEGMTTAVDVFSPKGQLILKRHQAISAFDIAKFGFYNIASVYVEGSSAQEKEEWNKKYAIIKEKYRDSIDNLHEYMNDILYRNIIPDKNAIIRDSVEIFDRFETSYELFDALQVLNTSGGVIKSASGNKMNEIGPHRCWAEKIVNRAKAYGVIKNEGCYMDLFNM